MGTELALVGSCVITGGPNIGANVGVPGDGPEGASTGIEAGGRGAAVREKSLDSMRSGISAK